MESFRRSAESELPTHFGRFRLVHYQREGADAAAEEAVALVKGEPAGDAVLCRVHSECLTGEVFGSLRCDCRAQLELALSKLGRSEAGVLIYLRQEGRGIGLANKIRAYALQDAGRDTVQANVELGFEPDERSYDMAAAMLRDLGVRSVRLMTNNPAKIEGLERHGIPVVEQVPHWVNAYPESRVYLETKRLRMGHIVPGDVVSGDAVSVSGDAEAEPSATSNADADRPTDPTKKASGTS